MNNDKKINELRKKIDNNIAEQSKVFAALCAKWKHNDALGDLRAKQLYAVWIELDKEFVTLSNELDEILKTIPPLTEEDFKAMTFSEEDFAKLCCTEEDFAKLCYTDEELKALLSNDIKD